MRDVRRPAPADLDRALAVVAAQLAPTPLLDAGDGLALKLETFQPTGSFKVRGAFAAMSRLARGDRVVTASAGNHGLGVALAAGRLGVRATVVVAESASPAKVEALGRFPVELVVQGAAYDEAERRAVALAAAAGAPFLSAYNDPDVIAGGATIGAELVAQVEGPLTVVCGIGGGGLSSGLGLWAGRTPGMTVVGVEAEASRAMSSAVAAGGTVEVEVGETVADGMAGNIEPGSVTVDLVREHVSAIVPVSEEEIEHAIRHLARSWGVVAEGAGAAPVAALLAGRVPVKGRAVAVVGGRNIALDRLARILSGSG